MDSGPRYREGFSRRDPCRSTTLGRKASGVNRAAIARSPPRAFSGIDLSVYFPSPLFLMIGEVNMESGGVRGRKHFKRLASRLIPRGIMMKNLIFLPFCITVSLAICVPPCSAGWGRLTGDEPRIWAAPEREEGAIPQAHYSVII